MSRAVLAAISPQRLVTRHGRARHGERVVEAMIDLARRLDEVAPPPHLRR